MQTLLLNLLLGRGLNKGAELLAKFVRHGASVAGGYLIASGIANAEQVATLEGAAVVLVSVGASAARVFLARYGK